LKDITKATHKNMQGLVRHKVTSA